MANATGNVNRDMLVRAFVLAAARANPAEPLKSLEEVICGRYKTEVVDGRTLIRTDDAGGSVQFILPPDFGPAEIMAIAYEAATFIANEPDPTKPRIYGRRIKRLKVSFLKTSFQQSGVPLQ
jgi:hypothetical protein